MKDTDQDALPAVATNINNSGGTSYMCSDFHAPKNLCRFAIDNKREYSTNHKYTRVNFLQHTELCR